MYEQEKELKEWEELLGRGMEIHRRRADWQSFYGLLRGFVEASQFAQESDSSTEELRVLFFEVVSELDETFPHHLTLDRVRPILQLLEEIPGAQLGIFHEMRFRLAQCLTMVGRQSEAKSLLTGLERMKKTEVGKRAFLWKWMQAAVGEVEEAIVQLEDFLATRVEAGDPLDITARLVLSRILIGRGYFRRARMVALEGVRGAESRGFTRDSYVLKNLYGVCLSFTGEADSGLVLMQECCDALEALGMSSAHVEARHTLAWACFELGDYGGAKAALQRVRPIYEEIGDRRNLRLLMVMEAIIAVQEGEGDREGNHILDEPTQEYWHHFEGERAFLRGLLARREGRKVEAADHFEQALEIHLEGGSVGVIRRILKEYLPLILEQRSFRKGRKLIVSLKRYPPQEQDLRDLEGELLDLIWLTGDLDGWGGLSLHGQRIRPERMMPVAMMLDTGDVGPSRSMDVWISRWEKAFMRGEDEGEDGEGEPIDKGGSDELIPLLEGARALLQGDISRCRRRLLLIKDLDLAGSLFGFIRGILILASTDSEDTDRAREEIEHFWQKLSPEILVHQLEWWEGVLENGASVAPASFTACLGQWLQCIQHWRVEGALLIDGVRGALFYGEARCEMEPDSMNFSFLQTIARQTRSGSPIGIEELFKAVWERPFNSQSSKNNVYVAVRSLRKELALLDPDREFIEHERGAGYRLTCPAVWAPSR